MIVAVGCHFVRHHGGVLKGSVLGGKGGEEESLRLVCHPAWRLSGEQTAATQRSDLLCLGCQLWVSSNSRLTSHCLNTDATHTLHLLTKNNTYYQTNTNVKVPHHCYCQIFSFHLGPRRRRRVQIIDEEILSTFHHNTKHTFRSNKTRQNQAPDWVCCRLALCDLTKQSHSMWSFHSMGSLT